MKGSSNTTQTVCINITRKKGQIKCFKKNCSINYNPGASFLEKWLTRLETLSRLCEALLAGVQRGSGGMIGSFYCINVSNGSTLFNNVGPSFICPSSPSHHVWSDSHMSPVGH